MESAEEPMVLMGKRGEDLNIALLTLNRPRARNALCDQLMEELGHHLEALDNDDHIKVIVITGQPNFFAAGADIKEMKDRSFPEVMMTMFVQSWDKLTKCRKPIIAAVNGFALGGGCELAMMCDIIYAGEGAIFGQPEITIGTMPGAGGTQRLCRLVGRPLAMEMCLTGRKINAQEALSAGLVSHVFPTESLVTEALKTAQKMADMSPVAIQLCKQSVNMAMETTLSAGMQYERSMFYSTFATEDRKRGMNAFINKEKPIFTGN